jgi:glycerol-3-phosphate acyltransferase PlsY
VILNLAITCVSAYLFGSLPFARLLVLATGHHPGPEEDLHLYLYNKVGRAYGMGAILFDMFIKGALTVTLTWLAGQPPVVMLAAGFCATIGQMWPVFERFNGGKGNTTGFGAFMALTLCLNNPVMWLGTIPIILGGSYKVISRLLRGQSALRGPFSNTLPLGVIIGTITIPSIAWAAGLDSAMVVVYSLFFVIIALRRLTANLAEDRRRGGSLGSMLLWRFLLDRSWLVKPDDKKPEAA